MNAARLSKTDLTGARVTSADLTGANFSGASLKGADLTGAFLTGAFLAGADLTGANLKGANFKGADFKGASLKGANLKGTAFNEADLRAADLTDADGLTQEQMYLALTDEKTKLPPGVTASPRPLALPSPTASFSSIQFLDELQPVESHAVTTGQASGNGHSYAHALTLSDAFDNSPAIEFNLGRNWNRLMGTLSVRDDASSKTNANFAIYFDGRQVMTGDLHLGAATNVDLDVKGVLRVRLEVKDATPSDCLLCGPGGGPFVWGDPRLTR